jgi:hypothetical protein
MRGGKRENSGRKKGSQNKTTKEIRNLFQELLETNFHKIQTDLDEMKPEQRVKTLMELSKFVIPTLKATEISGSNEKTIEISFID